MRNNNGKKTKKLVREEKKRPVRVDKVIGMITIVVILLSAGSVFCDIKGFTFSTVTTAVASWSSEMYSDAKEKVTAMIGNTSPAEQEAYSNKELQQADVDK